MTNYTYDLTYYIGQFTDQLYHSGVHHVVVSPGSRSTPLALTMAEYQQFNLWVDIDERSAAFYALGIAKRLKQPVCLLCTSGTAAANYYPAIIEAHYSRIPLIVLTADRPNELRDVGAPQAIDQIKMFGDYVKWFHEMALPSSEPNMLRYVRNQAKRAVITATSGISGVVHLNFPLREPLLPDFSLEGIWGTPFVGVASYTTSTTSLDEAVLNEIYEMLKKEKNGIIVCGPNHFDQLPDAIVHLAEKWQLPIFADPISGLRNGSHSKSHIIETYDAILKSNHVRTNMSVDFIIRVGAMPISKPYLLWIQQQSNVKHIVIDQVGGYSEPVNVDTYFLFGEVSHILRQLATVPISFHPTFLMSWQKWNAMAKEVLKSNARNELTEGHVISGIQSVSADDHIVFASNSMPIRDLDSFWLCSDKQIELHANRGANGIDGILSSASGMSATNKRTTLVVGDIAFLHSLNGLLMANKYHLPLTIVVVNNNGGGIFSFLPQAKQDSPHYELLFGTPQQMTLSHLAKAFDIAYEKPRNWKEYVQALTASYQRKDVTIIEVETERANNVQWHQTKWDQIEKIMLEELDGGTHVY
ncbi:2-succinyl-5-enolpyruvyl-6-hydroxy-3-cyclohexene-1-carboxylic-acid synthase [Gracilibacillus marinus]|uniref:2-succinyl-5-enolpyruvyl-6-hydroxy-3-cyclohexene-1-carboxylate synthase n=1 Tax=Gracilibacillus marinus TaxID=630535 RepID=A0ABV8VVC9_9BACI